MDKKPTHKAKKPHKLKYGYYLTVGKDDLNRLIATCTDGSPQRNHKHITILSVTIVENTDEASDWFRRVIKERPWDPTVH